MSDLPHRPNILFLMSDQHRADFTGYEGHVVRTPTLDWLARGGATFRNAYAPNPVCVPCRQAMAAGQLPRTCNTISFGGDLPPGYMTFAKRFTQYAYSTTCCGKLHHNGLDQMQGWSWRIGEEMHYPGKNIDGRVDEEFARYKRRDGNYGPLQSVLTAGKGVNPVEIVDDYTIVGALNYLRLQYANPNNFTPNDTPMLLKVSLIAPHDPFVTDSDSYEYYLNRVKPFPAENPIPELGGWPEPFDVNKTPPVCRQKAVAAYCAMIETVDRQFKRVLDALEKVGQNLDDWIIIYTSDHGEMLGEQNLWWKFRFLEGSVRVPLLIRAPRWFAGGQVLRQNVNLCDLFATLCHFAQIPAPGGLDSRSLLPLLQGRTQGWNNESISQLDTTRVMIKRDDLKYIYYETEGTEILFDLAANPRETVNFASDHRYASAMQAFRTRRAELNYGPNPKPGYVNAGYASRWWE